MTEKSRVYSDIGNRLKTARLALEPTLTQKEFAKKHLFNQTQYTNWELGVRRIPVDKAATLEKHYGLTLDFIYLGKLQTLQQRLASLLSDNTKFK